MTAHLRKLFLCSCVIAAPHLSLTGAKVALIMFLAAAFLSPYAARRGWLGED